MSYTARAFVRIKDVEKLKDLREDLKQLGYDCTLYDNNDDRIVFINEGVMGCVFLPTFIESFIDCTIDTNTEDDATALFLELAQMRDDVDEGQWFKWNMDWNISDGTLLKYDDIKEDCLQYYARAKPYQVVDNWDKLKRDM